MSSKVIGAASFGTPRRAYSKRRPEAFANPATVDLKCLAMLEAIHPEAIPTAELPAAAAEATAEEPEDLADETICLKFSPSNPVASTSLRATPGGQVPLYRGVDSSLFVLHRVSNGTFRRDQGLDQEDHLDEQMDSYSDLSGHT